jgi:hypothetical protein
MWVSRRSSDVERGTRRHAPDDDPDDGQRRAVLKEDGATTQAWWLQGRKEEGKRNLVMSISSRRLVSPPRQIRMYRPGPARINLPRVSRCSLQEIPIEGTQLSDASFTEEEERQQPD